MYELVLTEDTITSPRAWKKVTR